MYMYKKIICLHPLDFFFHVWVTIDNDYWHELIRIQIVLILAFKVRVTCSTIQCNLTYIISLCKVNSTILIHIIKFTCFNLFI